MSHRYICETSCIQDFNTCLSIEISTSEIFITTKHSQILVGKYEDTIGRTKYLIDQHPGRKAK